MTMKFGAPLSDELREKHGHSSVRPIKGDAVRIVRGSFKGIEGKITGVDTRLGKLFVEGVTREKQAGGKTSPVPIDASKVLITSLNFDDKLRRNRLEKDHNDENEDKQPAEGKKARSSSSTRSEGEE